MRLPVATGSFAGDSISRVAQSVTQEWAHIGAASLLSVSMNLAAQAAGNAIWVSLWSMHPTPTQVTSGVLAVVSAAVAAMTFGAVGIVTYAGRESATTAVSAIVGGATAVIAWRTIDSLGSSLVLGPASIFAFVPLGLFLGSLVHVVARWSAPLALCLVAAAGLLMPTIVAHLLSPYIVNGEL